jgi:PAS domain S-box-containing protein
MALVVWNGLSERENRLEKAEDEALLLAQALAAQQEQITAATREMLSTLAGLPAVQRLDLPACTALFQELNARHPRYSTISLVAPDGQLIAASTPFTPGSVNLADRKHVRDAIASRDFSVGEYMVGRVSRVQSLNYTYPVLDRAGTLKAIVVAGVKLEEAAKFLAQVKLPERGVSALTDHKGIRLLRLPEGSATPAGRPLPAKSFAQATGAAEQGVYEYLGEDGVLRLYAFKRLRLRADAPPYLYLFVGLPKGPILRAANVQLLRDLGLLGLAALLAAGLAWGFGTALVARPLQRLVTASTLLGKGEVAVRTELPHTPDEFGRLAQAFDEMAELVEQREREQGRAEEALRDANVRLETRVAERTAALQEREELFSSIVGQALDAIILIDLATGRFPEFNTAAHEGLGYTREEFAALTIHDIQGEHSPDVVRQNIARIQAEGGLVFETTLRHRTGSLRIARVSSRPLSVRGRDYLTAVWTDITERKRVEQALHEASNYHQSLIEASLDPLVTIGPDGRITDANRATEAATGYSRAELIGSDFSSYVTVPEMARAGFQQVLRDGEVRDYPLELRHADGHTTPILYNATVYRDAAGRMAGVFAAARDVTAQRRAEQALQAMNAELEDRVRERTAEVLDLYNHAPCGYHSLV